MKIALLGYGKMGKTIAGLALKKGYEIVYKSGRSFAEGDLNRADVAIEFSAPEAAAANIAAALEKGIPVVSGTTGWLEDYERIISLCKEKNGSFMYASNFSLGVNLFYAINEYTANLMAPQKDYAVSIEEIHHTEKKDAPSGTAITLAETILKYSEKKTWKLDGKQADELPVTARREKDVKGTHIITYESEIDTIQISHRAHSREGFAVGALLAASYIKDKKGVFSIREVFGIKS